MGEFLDVVYIWTLSKRCQVEDTTTTMDHDRHDERSMGNITLSKDQPSK